MLGGVIGVLLCGGCTYLSNPVQARLYILINVHKTVSRTFFKGHAYIVCLADLFVVRGSVFSVVEQIVHSRDGQQDSALSRVLLAL